MRRTGILTGGVGSLTPFSAARRSPSGSFSPLCMSVTPITVHTSVERSGRRLCGVWPNEQSEVLCGNQADVLTEQALPFMPISGLMVDRGSIIINEPSRMLIGPGAGHRENIEV